LQAQRRRLSDLNRALAAAREATRIASERYDRGLTDFLNVLDAERQQYALEELGVQAQRIEAEALVALFEALGGGWRPGDAIPPPRRPEMAVVAAFKYATNPARSP
jgi:outer membrane protein TolC